MREATDARPGTARQQEPRVAITPAGAGIAVAAGLLAAALAIVFGAPAILLVAALTAIPWVLSRPFSMYLVLLVTWPVATLYLNIELPGGLPDLRFERVITGALVGVVLVSAAVGRHRLPTPSLAPSVYLAAQLATYAHAAVAGPGAADPAVAINSVLVPFLLYWVTRALVTSRRRVSSTLSAITAAAILTAITGFYERWIGAIGSAFPVETGTASGLRYLDVAGGRAAGVFGNPAVYGAVVAMGVVSAIALLSDARGIKKAILMGSTAILGYAVVVSFTRSAWLAAAAAIVTAILVSSKRTGALAAALLSVLALGLWLAALWTPVGVLDNPLVQTRVLERENITGRLDRAAFSISEFGEHPIVGQGAGALDARIGEEFAGDGAGFDTSHNTYFTLLVDGGLVLFAAFIALMFSWLRSARAAWTRLPRGEFGRWVVGALVGIVAVFAVSGLALELKWFGYLTALCWVAGGMLENLGSNPAIVAEPGRAAVDHRQ